MMPAADVSQYWTPVYNVFNPFQPVPPEKLEAWFVERPDSPLSVILTHFRPDHLPERLILVGHPSSGKSSELARLAADLAQARFGYFVINLDLSRNLNIERVNQVEVLFLMGVAAYKLAEEAKLEPDHKRFDALVKALETLVKTHTENETFEINMNSLLRGLVCFGAGALAGPVGAAAAIGAMEVFRDFNFISGTDTNVVRKVEVEPKISEMLGHVNGILDDVRSKAGKPLALRIDGLDRVRDEAVTEMLFVHNRFLAEVGGRVLYAAPVYVYYQPEFAPVRQAFQTVPFPNVRLRQRDHPQAGDEAGYAAMRQVVNRRLGSVGYLPNNTIAREALDRLIAASGGVMRDLIRLVRDACVRAEIAGQTKIDSETAHTVVAALRREFEAQLTPKYQHVLDEVRKSKRRTEDPECDLLLKGNFILSYSNDNIWYDVHSILD